MGIRVSTPGGATIDFPDGTDEATITRVMQQASGGTPKKEGPGTLAAAAEGIAQGLTFNFADEIEGAGRAAYAKLTGDGRSWSDVYSDKVQVPRARLAAAKEGNPAAFYGGEIGSSLLVPGGLARAGIRGPMAAAANRGPGARTVAGLKEGAAYGAAYGAGAGEGESKLTSALSGAAVGGAVGAALPVAVDAASALTHRFVGQPAQAIMQPREHAANLVSQAFQRDASTGGGYATGQELRRVRDKIKTVTDLNPRAMIADAGGENVRNLMRASANVPSTGAEQMRRALDARQSTQHVRLADDVADNLKDGRTAWDRVDDIIARRNAEAAKLFSAAYASPTPMTPRLQDVLARPTARDAIKLAERRLQDEGKQLDAANLMQGLHRVKLEIDEMLSSAKHAAKMGHPPAAGHDVRTLATLKTDLINAIDNKAYKVALSRYAGPSALKSAAEDGADMFMTGTPREMVQKLMSYRTGAERDLFRHGAAARLAAELQRGNAMNDRVGKVFGSPDMQARLAAIFPDTKSRREFQRKLVIEGKMRETHRAVQGNSTTAKQLAQMGETMQPVRAVSSLANAAAGRLEPLLNHVSRYTNMATQGLTPSVANEVLRMGMSRDPRVMMALHERASRAAQEVPAVRAMLARQLMAGSGAAGTQ